MLKFRMRILFLLFITLALSFTMHAQTPLDLGDTTTAQITSAMPQATFTFLAIEGEAVQIDLIAIDDALLLQAVVFAPDGSFALAIGNSGDQNRVRGVLTATQSGAFSLQASSLAGGTGTFIVSLTGGAGSGAGGGVGSCGAFVEETLRSASEVCDGTGRNEACVGSTSVSGSGFAGVPLQFTQIGDTVGVADLETISLSPLDAVSGELGTVLMRLQANLPDTLPGQNVVMLLFGGVEIQNSSLTDAALGTQYGPMQAFFFRPGVGIGSCEEAPPSGLLVQTPETDIQMTFNVNDIEIQLASTMLFTFVEEMGQDMLMMSLLEGTGIVRAQGQTAILTGGQETGVMLNEDFRPASPPTAPRPIPQNFQLPLDILPSTETEADTVVLPTAPSMMATDPPMMATEPPMPTDIPTGRMPLPETGDCVVRSLQEDVNPNVRSGPGTNFGVISFLDANTTYTVAGRNADTSWWQTNRGWVANFVVEEGGDCSDVSVTFIPATATPLAPTPTPFVEPTDPPMIDVPCEDTTTNVNINPDGVGTMANLARSISHIGDCDGQWTVNYSVDQRTSFPNRDYRYSITCTGPGAAQATIFFSDGSSADCSSTAYNFRSNVTVRTQDSFQIGYCCVPPTDTVFTARVVFTVIE